MTRLLLILAAVLAFVAWRHRPRPRTWAAYNVPTYAGGSW